MLNRDVFAVDPTGRRLPNDGVTTLTPPTSEAEWAVLKYELQQFVVEGEYREGLRRVLTSYIGNVDKNQPQPACWVSGFYGSGKSHFLRVLTYLWTNPTIDGVSARSLVQLPDDVSTLLKEIDSFAKRDRTITFSAAGVLRNRFGGSVAQPLLEIVLGAAGLPTQYGQARFALWLKEEGVWDRFVDELQSRGKGPEEVNRRLFVSQPVWEALTAAMPGWAANAQEAGKAIRAQYQQRNVTDDMVIETIHEVLKQVARTSAYGDKASTPLMLLVLDELQQYVGDDVQLVLEVQDIVERLTREFGGRILVLAAGQSALTANEVLARFQDRFTMQVQLQSRDVETVVRQVVLRKDPVKVPVLADALEQVSGEIARHLGGSKFAHQPADQPDLVPDYPLLPTRRRFLESALRAIDRGGGRQVRSQLRVALDAARELAELPLGNVVPGDFIYRNKHDDMLQQGVLLHELSDRVSAVRDGTADGDVRARAAELVFLLGQIDESQGVRPTVNTLADLMVTDLNEGSATLRARLPDLLEPLVGDLLVLHGGDYRLQTRVDAEWTRAFKERRQHYLLNTAEQVQARDDAIRSRLDVEVSAIRITQGATKTPRKVVSHSGEQAPEENSTDLVLWVRSGWDAAAAPVRASVTEQGMDSPLVTVYLPKAREQDFKNAIADWRAAEYVLSTQPAPATEEGLKARDAMQSQSRRAKEKVDRYASDVVEKAQVLLGGGEVVAGSGSIASALREALEKAAVRKFPRFRDADNASWPTVFKRAKEGNANALTVVGHQGQASTHAVVREVKAYVDRERVLGSKIHRYFQEAEFGWPRDAVNAALAVLVQSEEVSAWDGAVPVPAMRLTEGAMGKLQYQVERVALTIGQKQRLKALARSLDLDTDSVDVLACLKALAQVASTAGGDAPLPPTPDVAGINRLEGRVGVERDAAVADAADELMAKRNQWHQTAEKAADRMNDWRQLQRLVQHAQGLPSWDQHKAVLDAVMEQRSLLDDPSPIADLTAAVKTDLREALAQVDREAKHAYEQQMADLQQNPHWQELDEDERHAILANNGFESPETIEIENDTQLVEQLDRRPLSARRDIVPAIFGRGDQVKREARERRAPQAVRVVLPSIVLTSAEEAEDYLSALRHAILEPLAEGRTVSIEG